MQVHHMQNKLANYTRMRIRMMKNNVRSLSLFSSFPYTFKSNMDPYFAILYLTIKILCLEYERWLMLGVYPHSNPSHPRLRVIWSPILSDLYDISTPTSNQALKTIHSSPSKDTSQLSSSKQRITSVRGFLEVGVLGIS